MRLVFLKNFHKAISIFLSKRAKSIFTDVVPNPHINSMINMCGAVESPAAQELGFIPTLLTSCVILNKL